MFPTAALGELALLGGFWHLTGMGMAFTGLLQLAGEKELQAAAQCALYVALLLYLAWYDWRLTLNLRRLKAGDY